MVEKFRYYEKQSILNILVADTNWHNLTYGALACPNPNVTAWGQVLKERKSLYLKNQGLSNDNTTAGTIEVYFGQYHIDHIEKMITYDSTTNRYTVDVGPGSPLIPTSNQTYLILEPFSASTGSDVSDRNTISAVLRNVVWVGGAGTVYTFQLDGYELIALADFGPAAAWAWTTKWTHTAGTATSLASTWTPSIGEKYKIEITNVTTTGGTGYYITCGGITFPIVTTSGTTTYWVDAETAGALTFVLGAGGTWAGAITAVSVETYDHKVNTLLQNNIATKPVDFYDYTVPVVNSVPVIGIILATGESYSGDITHDVILYYRGSVQNQTLVVQQFA